MAPPSPTAFRMGPLPAGLGTGTLISDVRPPPPPGLLTGLPAPDGVTQPRPPGQRTGAPTSDGVLPPPAPEFVAGNLTLPGIRTREHLSSGLWKMPSTSNSVTQPPPAHQGYGHPEVGLICN